MSRFGSHGSGGKGRHAAEGGIPGWHAAEGGDPGRLAGLEAAKLRFQGIVPLLRNTPAAAYRAPVLVHAPGPNVSQFAQDVVGLRFHYVGADAVLSDKYMNSWLSPIECPATCRSL